MKAHKAMRQLAELVKVYEPKTFGVQVHSRWREVWVHAETAHDFNDLEAAFTALTGTRESRMDDEHLHKDEWEWEDWRIVLTVGRAAAMGLEVTA